MECKYCHAELEEGSSVCPECGKDNHDKNSLGKIVVGVVAAISLLAVLAVVVITGSEGKKPTGSNTADTTGATVGTVSTVDTTVPADGNSDDVTCKGTYTVSDDVAAQESKTVIATLGNSKLTNGLLQVYYWNQFYSNYVTYVSSYGMDLTAPLDAQLSPDEITWQQTILAEAISNWRIDAAMAELAMSNNFQLSPEMQEELDNMEANLEAQAKAQNYDSFDEMIQESMGAGCTVEDYLEYGRIYYYATAYYNQELEKITVSDAEMADFFAKYEATFTEQGIDKTTRWIDVRHILIQPEGCTFDANNYVVADEDQWEACRKEAQKVLDDWLANDGTEEGFGELAKELTADGNGEQGGLYEKVSEGQMVQTFNDWCFDASRVPGDSGLVKTNFGYHIMYFVGSEYVWEYYAEQSVLSMKKNDIYVGAAEGKELSVDYTKIVLGDVNFLAG